MIWALRRKSSRRQGREGLDPLFHLTHDGLEQAGDLGPGLDLLPLAVPLVGQVNDLRLQLQDAVVRRIIVGLRLPLTAGLLGTGLRIVGPGHILVDAAGGDVRDHRAADLELLGDPWLGDPLGHLCLDGGDSLIG